MRGWTAHRQCLYGMSTGCAHSAMGQPMQGQLPIMGMAPNIGFVKALHQDCGSNNKNPKAVHPGFI